MAEGGFVTMVAFDKNYELCPATSVCEGYKHMNSESETQTSLHVLIFAGLQRI